MAAKKQGFEGIDRSSRAKDNREKEQRRKPWAPPSMLEAPPAPEGYKHRWIRKRFVVLTTARTFLHV